MEIKWVGADKQNFRRGRGAYHPLAIVVHLAVDKPDKSLHEVDDWFRNPAAIVSAHYGISQTGEVHQYVKDEDTAYHAGRVDHPTWLPVILGGVNPNNFTIGIEHEGDEKTVWTAEMVDASATLIATLCHKWSIPIDRFHIVGHREIYAVKTCPGPLCPLDKIVELARAK